MDFLPDFWRENLNILMVFKIIKKSENIFRRENSNFWRTRNYSNFSVKIQTIYFYANFKYCDIIEFLSK